MKLLQYKIKDNHVSYPGTNQFWDLLVILNLLPKGGVHRGVKRHVDKYYWDIISELDFRKPISVSGHSLGGGAAQYLAKRLSKDFNIQVKCHVIGSIKIWTDPDEFENECEFVVYGNDPVPFWFPWYKTGRNTKIVHEGPKRKWWRINFKDHVRY